MAIFNSYVSLPECIPTLKIHQNLSVSVGSHWTSIGEAKAKLGLPSSLATASTVPAPQKGSITVCSPGRDDGTTAVLAQKNGGIHR